MNYEVDSYACNFLPNLPCLFILQRTYGTPFPPLILRVFVFLSKTWVYRRKKKVLLIFLFLFKKNYFFLSYIISIHPLDDNAI